MAFNVIDEVTADCLQTNDLILVPDTEGEKEVYFVIDEMHDEGDVIIIYGYSLDNDDDSFKILLDPDQKISLYMEADDE